MQWLLLLLLFFIFPYCRTAYNISADCVFRMGSLCNWKNMKGGDEFDWSLRTGRTPSTFTGPNSDHTTGSGYYAYIESSYPRSMGDFARLVSPRMRGAHCMVFWYHMYGEDMGRVIVHVNATAGLRALWFKAGNLGNRWIRAQVDIQEAGPYEIFIDGIVGTSFQGDAAIDDISFTKGKCNSTAFLSVFLYGDETNHGYLSLQSDPSPGVRTFHETLELSQASLNPDDEIFLICKRGKEIYIEEMESNPRLPLKCPPWDFFFSPRAYRVGLIPVYIINRGPSMDQLASLHNRTRCCGVDAEAILIYAAGRNFSANPLHGAKVSQSSEVAGFSADHAVDGDFVSCSKTNSETNPWLEAELDGSHHIYKVYVSARKYCCQAFPLPIVNVTISNGHVSVTCLTTDQRADECSRAFLCQPPLRARKVRVEMPGEKKELVVCEIVANYIENKDQLRGVRREIWTDLGSSSQISSFTGSAKRLGNPNTSGILPEFRAQDANINNYGQRLTAFIQPPMNGSYKFYTMCDDQCKAWLKRIQSFTTGELKFVEDLKESEQKALQLAHVTIPSGFYDWDRFPQSQHSRPMALDSCSIFMVEGVMKEATGMDYLGIGWKLPNGNKQRPITTDNMYWLLTGMQDLEVHLEDAVEKNISSIVGNVIDVRVLYKLCCIGIHCCDCAMTIILLVIDKTVVIKNAALTTCKEEKFTAKIYVDTHPGNFPIKVSSFATNHTSQKTSQQIVGHLVVKALIVQSCLYNDRQCKWVNFDSKGRTGWILRSDELGPHYILRETKTAWLQSETVQIQPIHEAIGLCLRFKYKMAGGEASLSVIVKNLYNRSKIWVLSGMQGKSWIDASLPWINNTASQIVLEGTLNSNKSISVTSIRLITESCQFSPTHATPGYRCKSDEFQCNNGMCVSNLLRCDGDYACVDESDELNCACRTSEFKCPDGKCIHQSKFCNGIEDCKDGSDEKSCKTKCSKMQFICADGSCIPWKSTCNKVIDCQDGSDEPDICDHLNCPLNKFNCLADNNTANTECQGFRGTCTFENGLCGLISDSTAETEWIVGQGSTPTTNTGPEADYTTSTVLGSYLYLEASSQQKGDRAVLHSDWLSGDDVMCLQFWYHMLGRHIGDLRIYVRTNSSRNGVWRTRGSKGGHWAFGQTPIDTGGEKYQFVLEATVGPGSEGDIAIDDLSLINGPCSLVQGQSNPNCLFEDGLCDWEGNIGWVNKKASDSSVFSPEVPERKGAGSGFIRTDTVKGNSIQNFEISTPELRQSDGFLCARFWYYIVASSLKAKGGLTLKAVEPNRSAEVLWSTSQRTRQWTHAQMSLSSERSYKLRFIASVAPKQEAIALDDVIFLKEPCETQDGNNVSCKQKTTDGDCCSFPFVYKGKCYPWCIGDGINRLWCAITDNYDRDGLWGSCDEGSGPAIYKPCSVRTKQGPCCVLPFQYDGRLHNSCVDFYHTGPWCATTDNYDRDRQWGDCIVLGAGRVIRPGCEQKTTDGRCCVLPFTYESKAYNACVTYRTSDRPWCSLTGSYDRDPKQWAPCAGFDDPDNCPAIYRAHISVMHWSPAFTSSRLVHWSSEPRNTTVNISDRSTPKPAHDKSLYEAIFNGSSPKKGASVQVTFPELRALTVCLWMVTEDVTREGTPYRYRVRYHERDVTGFALLNYQKFVMQVMDNNGKSSLAVNDGKWHHLCITWDSRGGVWQFYNDGLLVTHGLNWHKGLAIPGRGTLFIGWDGLYSSHRFLGNMSGLNIWSHVISRTELSRHALGCGLEMGDVMFWEGFRNSLKIVVNISSPPKCTEVKEGGFILVSNFTSGTPVTADLQTSRLISVSENDVSACFSFRYMLLGSGARKLAIYQLESNVTSGPQMAEQMKLKWLTTNSTNMPLWKFGYVTMTTMRPYKIVIRGTLVPGSGSIGIAEYVTNTGRCYKKDVGEYRACHLNLTSPFGSFSSPRYPEKYPNSLHCMWRIIRAPGDVIRLRILAFNLQHSPGCSDDSLSIYDGGTIKSRLLGRWCGDVYPKLIESSSNVLTLLFRSNEVTGQSGFSVSYNTSKVSKDRTEVCSRVEDCPSSCSCSYTNSASNKRIVVQGLELTAIPRVMPQDTVALMFSGNRISRVESNSFIKMPYLRFIDLSRNNIMRVTQKAFHDLYSLNALRLHSNFLTQLRPSSFVNLPKLRTLDMANNLLREIPNGVFKNTINLQVLSFHSNSIRSVAHMAFGSVTNLTHLYLQHNKIESLPDNVFWNLTKLHVLYLNDNKLKTLSRRLFRGLSSLRILKLENNKIGNIEESTFNDLGNLQKLTMDRFIFCCFAVKTLPNLRCRSPENAFSSCDDLMKNKALQVCIWILGLLALVGNCGVVIWRVIVKERNKVHSFLLTNLAVADWLMGCYLIIIAIKDLEWRGEYFKHDLSWRSSKLCQFSGAISMISSEVSVLILTVITADRFACIVFAFKFKRLKMKSASYVVLFVWLFGIAVSVFPIFGGFDYFYDHSWQAGFYGRSAVCLPLQLSQERYPGWEYSVSVFIVLNAVAFTFILLAYAAMFWKVRTAGRSVRSTRIRNESSVAKRMVFIILTDLCCWMPVIIIGVLSLFGRFADPEKQAYVWIAVFVLPVNSSINPVLYTFSTREWRRTSDAQSYARNFITMTTRMRQRISIAIRQGSRSLQGENMEMVQEQSITAATTMGSTHSLRSARDSLVAVTQVPTIRIIGPTNVFQGEFSPSTGFYLGLSEGKLMNNTMCLLKHFASNQKGNWEREVEVMLRTGKDGGHPNVIKYLWHKQANKVPIEYDKIKLPPFKRGSWILCYEFVSSTTLSDYLRKTSEESVLVPQLLLAIASDVINALRHLKCCDVIHNNVVPSNILIQTTRRVPPVHAILGGFGKATHIGSARKLNNSKSKNHDTDIGQYGHLLKHLLEHCPENNGVNQISRISDRCIQAINKPTVTAIREMLDEAWDQLDIWDTCL